MQVDAQRGPACSTKELAQTCCALRAEFRDMQTQTKNAMQLDQWKITNPVACQSMNLE